MGLEQPPSPPAPACPSRAAWKWEVGMAVTARSKVISVMTEKRERTKPDFGLRLPSLDPCMPGQSQFGKGHGGVCEKELVHPLFYAWTSQVR